MCIRDSGYVIGSHEGEGPFELDATERVRPGLVNLLAVRVVNPTAEAIDGLVLSEVPHANKTLPADFRPGWAYNFGGILGDVVVHVELEARLLDVAVHSQLATGVISVDVTVSAAALRRAPMAVNVLISEAASGFSVASAQEGLLLGGCLLYTSRSPGLLA